MNRLGCVFAACLAAAVAATSWAADAQERIHGADSLFVSPGLKLAWAVLKGTTEDETKIVVRLINVTGAHRFMRVDGIDPFSKGRTVFVEARPLGKSTDIVIPRAKFADHPSAEIYLFRDDAAVRTNSPALVVYYLGVPDTTPEFANSDALGAYLNKMLGIGP